ncbi:MAG: hypothetical protein ACE5IT_08315 [bacterium]
METTDSVNSVEVIQWRNFNKGKERFYLIVPENLVEKAVELTREEGFSIDGIGYYNSALTIHLAGSI